MLRSLMHKTPPIGLDIGIDGIRMLQLDAIGKAVSAVAAARWKFPDAAVFDPQLRRTHAVDAVRQMLADGDFRGRKVVTCLGGDDLIIKQARLPRLSDSERRAAVQWEANDRFGFQVSPELLHHVVAGEVRVGNEIRDELILLGATDEAVDSHVAMLGEMGVTPVCIDAEPAGLFRPFERFLRRGGDVNTASILVDIGAAHTWVVFARGRKVGFLKSIDIGGRHFSEAVAEQLHMEYSEAVELRRQTAADCDDADGKGAQVRRAVFDAIRPVAEDLTREISLCLRYCSVTFRGSRPERVTVVGSQAHDPTLLELMNEYISVECELGRPLRGVDLSQVELGGDHRGPLSEWSVAAGLALREVLANQERREKKHEPDRLSA